MKTCILTLSGLICFSLSSFSQTEEAKVKVYDDGRVKMRGDRPVDDSNKQAKLNLYILL